MAAIWWTDESGLEFERVEKVRYSPAEEACANCGGALSETCKTCGLGFCSRECNETFHYVLATKAVS